MTIYLWGWYEVAFRIGSGDIATDLYRPLDFQLYWLAQDLGAALTRALPRAAAVCRRRARVRPPVARRPGHVARVLVSVALAVMASFAFRFLYNLTAFWLLDYRGVGVLASSRRVPLGDHHPGRVLPGLAEGDCLRAAVPGDGADAGRRLRRQRDGSRARGAARNATFWVVVLLSPGAWSSRGHAEAGGPGWLRRSRPDGSTGGWSAPDPRAAAVPGVVRARPRRDVR